MRDANEREIVEALVNIGASVTRLNETGVPDLLVGYQGTTYLLEVKRPRGPRGGVTSSTTAKKRADSGEMTEAQERWWARWNGGRPVVVRTPEDALQAVSKPRPETSPHEPSANRRAGLRRHRHVNGEMTQMGLRKADQQKRTASVRP